MFSYSILPPLLQKTIPTVQYSRHAAVAMILRDQNFILMMQRAKHEHDPWSGHMAFPGGGFEEEDQSLKDTAERECKEEVGLDLCSDGVYLGGLSRMNHPKICVDAFVYSIESEPVLSPNEEVAGLFWISLRDLVNPKNRGTIQHTFQGQERTFPTVHLPGIPAPIWGLSLGFLDQLFYRWSNA
jgi:8-oxo-dGTP pyrophosphatase MutT (NUDIX family)